MGEAQQPGFNPIEFDGIKKQAGLNSFVLTARQWIAKSGAIGISSQPGRYGGTFAHTDIAFEFASWISVEFKLYLIKEFQRLKEDENRRLSLAWNLNRTLSKLNYRIHTDAVKAHLVPREVSPAQAATTYANEADVLNVSLFGFSYRTFVDKLTTFKTRRYIATFLTSRDATDCARGQRKAGIASPQSYSKHLAGRTDFGGAHGEFRAGHQQLAGWPRNR